LRQSRVDGAGRAGPRLAALVAGLALAVTACGGGTAEAPPAAPTGSDPAAYPVTVTDGFGPVEIPAAPRRVAALTTADADVLVALGVTPVLFSSPSWIPNGINPWLSDALGGEPAPEGFDNVDGLPLEQIANAQPDLIVGVNEYGITDYREQLGQIAPTIAWDDAASGQLGWPEHTRLIGDALGLRAEADQLVADTQAKIAEVRAAHPDLAGKQALFAVGAYDGALFIGVGDNPYNRLLTDLGLTVPDDFDPSVTDLGLSFEQLDQLSGLDVLIFQPTDQAEYDAFVGLDLARTLPVVQKDGIVELIDPVDAGSTTVGLRTPSVLSVPWVLDRLVPRIEQAARNTAA
jgi:iron complex transport system substrate-binding protein